jgi:hypothetical protein
MTALSIRQPWAWLIVNGYKDVENRDWPTSFRGTVLIHAGKGMTRAEYADCRDFALDINPVIPFPDFDALQRGGIVGEATITECSAALESPWFVGVFGFVLSNAKPLRFAPVRGQLGFFNVKKEELNG